MSLGGFFKKVTNVARAAGNPGGSLIRAARGQPVVGHNSFKSVADPLNAVTPAPYPGATGPASGGSYQPMYQMPAQTGTREQMVAAAIARNATAQQPPQPQPPVMGTPVPNPSMQAPAPQAAAPKVGMMDPRMMANVMRTM